MWKLTIEDDQANRTVVHLVREDYSLGRSEENAIRLTERNISRRHAALQRSPAGTWFVRDLSSYNGSYINGHRVVSAEELTHGDLVQVGDYRLFVENEAVLENDKDTTATVPAPYAAVPNTSVDRMVMLMGPTPGAEIVLSPERLIVGRGEDCDISINHASVSRIHCELHPTGDGRYEILDKGSANGVRINGVELPRGFVDARDVIELGDVILKFIPAGESYTLGSGDNLQLAAIGAARRQEAEEGLGSHWTSSPWVKAGIGIALVVLLSVIAFLVIGNRGTTADLTSVKDEATATEERVLAEAKRLLQAGDVRSAYTKAGQIQADAPARETADFRAIQAAYADLLFAEADKTHDLSDKRSLYDQIARSPTIDGTRRRRAVEQLAALSPQAVDVTELPSARPVAPPPSALPAPLEPPEAIATQSRRGATLTPAQAKESATAAATVQRPLPLRTSSPRSATPPKSGNTGLVRENPY